MRYRLEAFLGLSWPPNRPLNFVMADDTVLIVSGVSGCLTLINRLEGKLPTTRPPVALQLGSPSIKRAGDRCWRQPAR